MSSKLETAFEKLLFSARWILAPIFLGLSLALIALGPGCQHPMDDFDGRTDLTGGASGSGGSFSVGGSGGDLIFDGECEDWCVEGIGGASGGTFSQGGLGGGGLGGAR